MKNLKCVLAVLIAMAGIFITGCQGVTPSVGSVTVNPVMNARSAATATSGGATVVLAWTNPSTGYYGSVLSCAPAEGTLKKPISFAASVSSFTVENLSPETEYTFFWKSLDGNGNETSTAVSLSVTTPKAGTKEYTQAELQALLDADSKNAVFETVLSGKNASELLGKLSAEKKGDLLNLLLIDEVNNSEYSGNLTAAEKAQIFNELLSDKRTKGTFLSLLTDEEKTAVYNGELTTEKKAAIFTEVFTDKRTNGKVVELLNDAEKEAVFDALLETKTSVDFVKEILNKTENTELRTSIKNYLVSELSQEELVAILDAKDTTAPGKVTALAAENTDASVHLSWTDATDSDVLAYEITYTSTETSRAVSFEENSIVIPQGTGNAYISGLANGKTYTFKIKTVDTTGNKSEAETVSCDVKEIEKQPLSISLIPSVTAITNQNYDVTVQVTSDSSVKKIAYKTSSSNDIVESVFENGTDITSSLKFTVSENGTYSVAAQDVAGRWTIKKISIGNIDKAAPAKVANLAAVYSCTGKKITLTWSDPSDSDFTKAEISYGKSSEEATTVEVSKGIKILELTGVETTSETYTFSVISVDNFGNRSQAAVTTVKTVPGPYVENIETDIKHLSGTQEERTVNVTVYGSNFDKISEQQDTTFKIQVVDSLNSVTNYDAVINTAENKATAAVTIPAVSNASDEGTDFTIRTKLCGITDTTHTATVNVSSDWEVWYITLDTEQIALSDVTASSKVHVTVSGTNLDLAKNAVIRLYDSTGEEYTASATTITVPTEVHATSLEADVKIPTVDDKYTIKISSGETVSSATKTLQVYDVPQFTSFTIPPAGTAKEDNVVKATVKGKNFKAPGVTSSSFTVSCDSKISVTASALITVVNDSILNVTLTIPGTAGSYEVKITSGANSQNGTFTVKDYTGIAAGDFIKKDGTTISKDTELTAEQKADVVAIVGGFNTNGGMFGLGLKQSSSTLQWAPDNTTGHHTNFTGIVAYSDKNGSGAASTAVITGDTDGSDNWDYVKSIDPTGTADAATNYPAFNYAANYGTTAGLEGDLAAGWYMPSIAELCELYKNKEVLNTSLSKAGGTEFENSWYWSSSQSSYYYNYYYYAWLLLFSNGDLSYGSYRRDYNSYVCCVRAF